MEPFIGQIMMFAGNFAPRGWAFCDGQLLPINNYTALFSILGTNYGGDGRTTFALPDLRGRTPVHAGQGTGLTNRRLGQKAGVEDVTLNINQTPSHQHKGTGTILANDKASDSSNPKGKVPSIMTKGVRAYADQHTTMMKDNGLEIVTDNVGGNQAHSNMQPFQVINFIIALEGVYPSRS